MSGFGSSFRGVPVFRNYVSSFDYIRVRECKWKNWRRINGPDFNFCNRLDREIEKSKKSCLLNFVGICCSSVLIESVSQSGKIDRLDFNFWNRLDREIEKSKGKILFEF